MALNKSGAPLAVPKPEKKKGGNSPRQKGDRIERIIAKDLGEKRTVGSGAFKNTNKNLTGDLDARDANGREYVKIEVKYTGKVLTNGEKAYTLTTKVLDQMQKEAEDAHEIGALIIHFKGGKQYVVMEMAHWKMFLEDARLGRTMR